MRKVRCIPFSSSPLRKSVPYILKPFPKEALINRLHDLDQNRVCRNHSSQESIVLGSWRGHPNRSVELGNIRNAYDDASDDSGQDDNRGRRSRLKERYFSRSKEMDNEDLYIYMYVWGWTVRKIYFFFWYMDGRWQRKNLTCVKAPSVNQLVWASGTSGESSDRILYIYQFVRKTQMSNTLDVGPIKIMKRAMDLAFQTFGAARYSRSTLSQGIVAWEKS